MKITPITLELFKNDRGFYVRMKPEAPGRVGKIFFPDREGMDLDALYQGPIVIDEIFDRGNYGFFRGHMREMNAPIFEGLVHYILDKGYWNGYVEKYRTPTGDEFAVLRMMDGCRVTDMKFLEQSINTLERGDVEDYASEVPFMDQSTLPYCTRILEPQLISDFITQYFHGEDYENIYRRFEIARLSYKIDDRQNLRENSKFISKIFDDAINEGIIYFYKYGSIPIVEINMLTIPYLIPRYTTAEINELIRDIHKINQAANAAIVGALLHHKMRIIRKQFAYPDEMKSVSRV